MHKIFLLCSILLLTTPIPCFAFFCDFSSVAGQTVSFSELKKICPRFGTQMEHKAKKMHKQLPSKVTVQNIEIRKEDLPLKYKFPELNRTCTFYRDSDTAICY